MKKVLAVLLAAIFALSCLSGCREQPLLDPHDPVVLTLWHTYITCKFFKEFLLTVKLIL